MFFMMHCDSGSKAPQAIAIWPAELFGSNSGFWALLFYASTPLSTFFVARTTAAEAAPPASITIQGAKP